MLESFAPSEQKEVQQEVDYDKLVKSLYISKTWEEFEKNRNNIITRYKNDKTLEKDFLLKYWIDNSYKDNRNQLLENIKTKEELFELINKFSTKFPIVKLS